MDQILMLDGRRCLVTSAVESLDLSQRTNFYMFVSLKNPMFNSDLIDWFVRLSNHYAKKAFISIVDTPYLYNEKAVLDRELLAIEIQRIYRISDERLNQVQRVLRRFEEHCVSIVKWDNLVQETPTWLRDELNIAFAKKLKVYDYLIEHITQVRDNISGQRQAEDYAQFLLAELPTLIYLYYHPQNNMLDVYPGINIGFYRLLENGVFAEELPRMTDFACQGLPLMYINACPVEANPFEYKGQ